MHAQFDDTGLKQLVAVFDAAPQLAAVEVSKDLIEGMRSIRSTAAEGAPRRTERLARSLRAVGGNGSQLRQGAMEADLEALWYGVFAENGTSEQPPQPFANPATDRHLPEIEARLAITGASVIAR